MDPPPLLDIRNLSIEFETSTGPVKAVRDFSLTLRAGRKVAIVGESGSGKSTIAAAMNGLLAENGRIASGEILFERRDLTHLPEARMLELRGNRIGLVPQDPMTNLNPLQRVGIQIAEGLEVHGKARGRAAFARAVELLGMVGIPEPARRARQYPHELSGGMRQRVLIAAGLACEPSLLLADEPTSALDVTVQKVVMDELDQLVQQLGTALVLITHDLALAANYADDVVVMYRGDLVESGPAREILSNPQHDYTRRLLAAVPRLDSPRLVGDLPPEAEAERPLVEMADLSKVYGSSSGWLGKGRPFVAVAGSTISIRKGQTVSIVGESGSGKSTTARMLLRIEDPSGGSIRFGDQSITDLKGVGLFAIRRRLQPVFQNPFGTLDPRYTVLQSIEEPLILHGIGTPKTRAARVMELLDYVALPASIAARKPSEISGGQSQRVAIARALTLEPELVVLDEAVSALDVIVQMQILELLIKLQKELGLSYLFISHDLAVVRQISHVVHVMCRGEIVESAPTEQLFANPRHAYTKQLISAIPSLSDGPRCTDRAATPPGSSSVRGIN